MRCLNCDKPTNNPKFCGLSCSASYGNRTRTFTIEQKQKINAKISTGVKRVWAENRTLMSAGEKHSRAVGNSTKGTYKGNAINSLYEISSRTAQKVLRRMNLGCSLCGWNKASCDIHHISGRKIENPHAHANLTLVCPNCHREIHSGLINKDTLVTLSDYLPKNWKEFYYG